MTPPRVALFPSAFHPHVGGVEELTRRLALQLHARGATPLVVSNRYPPSLPRRETVDGLPVVRERFSVPEPRWRHAGGYVLHSPATRRRLRTELAAHGSEVLHVQCVSTNGYYVLIERRRTRLPLVLSLQGELSMDAGRLYQRSALMRRTLHALLAEADLVTGCSRYVLDEAETFAGRPWGQGRARVVPNGVEVAELAGAAPYRHPRPYVLAVGRMVPQKGFDVLLRGFAATARRQSDLDLLLAGDGPELGALRALAAQLGLAERTRFLGGVARPEISALFRGAAAFVLPSRHEPQGIVVLEAMAAGVPVLAADVGGVAEIVQDGQNGLLCRAEDPAHLAARLEVLLAHGPFLAAAATAREHDWAVVTDSYADCYAQACRRAGAASGARA